MKNGQRVVCIDDTFPEWVNDLFISLPIKDHTYTIRDMLLGETIDGSGGEICVYLVGLHNPIDHTHCERGFKAERFRPLEELPPEEMVEERELQAV